MLLCPTCSHPNRFTNTEALEAHLAIAHYKCLPYPCVSCLGAQQFHSEASLREHYQRDHGLEGFEITFSPTEEERFQMRQIAILVRTALQVELEESGFTVGNDTDPISSQLEGTSKQLHTVYPPVVKQEQVTVFETETFQAESTSAGFKPIRNAGLSKPKLTKSETNQPILGIPAAIDKVRTYLCVACGKQVKEHAVFYHINTEHLKLTITECELCGKVFTDYYANKHTYTHLRGKHKLRQQSIEELKRYVRVSQANKELVRQEAKNYFPDLNC